MFVNSSMIEARPIRGDIELLEIPANDIAKGLGNERVVNMVMLGFFIKKTGLVSRDGIEKALEETFSSRGKALVTLNKKAFMEGHNYD
jgi:2-oxoglutarate ferredoxin oxidoreductase subunit gamma